MASGQSSVGQTGSGAGISRGPGAAPITWGEETPDLRAQMNWKAMAAPDSPEEAMQIMKITSIAPTTDAVAENVATADVMTKTSGEAVWKRRMKPEHRQAVRRFFKRKN